MSEDSAPTAREREPSSPLLALAIVSFASLFLEIALIRWLSSEVRIFSHVRNVALIGCFVGLALGYPQTRLRLPLWASPMCALLLIVASLPTQIAGEYTLKLLAHRLANSDVFEVLSLQPLLKWVPGLFQFLLAFVVLLFVFFPMGQRIGELLRQLGDRPLRAYSVNILASLAGVIAFNVTSLARWNPPTWVLLGFVFLAFSARSQKQIIASLGLGFATFTACIFQQLPDRAIVEQIWSPYQKVEVWGANASPGDPWKLKFTSAPERGTGVPFYMLASSLTTLP